MALLEAEGFHVSDVDVFAVATGPGAFTGLRVGIATMQALAFAGRKPLVGVSALDALAAIAAPFSGAPHGGEQQGTAHEGTGAGPSVRVATWVDAWRGEIYAALYANGAQIEDPVVAPPAALLERLRDDPPLFIGDAAGIYADMIRTMIGPRAAIASPAAPLLASTIAAMAGGRVRAGECPLPDAIRPLYVRRSDAELTRDARARG